MASTRRADALEDRVDCLSEHLAAFADALDFLGPQFDFVRGDHAAAAHFRRHGKRDVANVVAAVL